MCIYGEKRDPSLVFSGSAPHIPPNQEVVMIRRHVATAALLLASLALAACADATGPNSTPKKECGITIGSGICAPK